MIIEKLKNKANTNKLITKVLINRGYDEEIINALLSTGYSEELPAYNDITNVETGADIIESHIANNSTIHIFADYDADGTCSSYILGDAISYAIWAADSSSSLNIKVPERYEGYGLNMKWCKSIVDSKSDDETILVITVDNGIAQDKEVAYLLSNGIDVLITDHHMPNGHTPQEVVIIDAFYNNDNINNKGLCGAGVAFKLAMTLLERYDIKDFDDLYYKYLIHVAIATITDSMPMTIDNIRYVYNGLQLLKDGYGSDAINHYREFNSNTDLTPKDIAFGLGPQINSGGRMCNASLAIDYLFANDDDVEDLYNSIVKTNDERKAKTKKAIETAEEMIDINKLSIVLNLSDVEGIAGIIASNVVSKYRRPTIVFSQAGDVLIGSGRSIDGINLLSVIKQIEANTDYIVKVGGHASACGITIKKQYFNDFCNALYNALENITVVDNTEEQEELRIVVDDYITVSDINKDNCEILRSLYFFTESNPVFALNDITITKVKYSGNNPNNICFDIKDKTGSISTWTWGVGDMYKMLGEPKQVSIIAELDTKFGKPSLNILNIIPKGEINYEK